MATLTPPPTISKGEMLGRIFARMDQLRLTDHMLKLFKKNGLPLLDLTALRKAAPHDFHHWNRLHRRSNRLMSLVTYTVLNR